MAELKTKKNDGSVMSFLESPAANKRLDDSLVILGMMKR